ncbi:MAG TPA: hypothetical protein VHY59_11660, partial [Chthoniobacterales bacterium]|nr:hypothetical protein [Chthoniobacterales bacterium]
PVFARIMLHKPRWVVIDRALDALDDDAHTLVIGLFNDELKDAVIINIGRPETERKHFFTHVLRLIKDPRGRCFLPSRRVASAGRTMAAPSQS